MFVPGRILVIDDVPEEVEKVIDSLRHKGESVLFTTSMPEQDTFFENMRLLIIDLHLGGDKDTSYDAVTAIIEKANQKTRFFVIALWTKYAKNNDKDLQIVEDLKNLYNQRAKAFPEEQRKRHPLKAIFLRPFGKTISQSELFGRIKKALISHPECGMLFEIERSIESARDCTVSDFVATAAVPTILKSLKEEVGDLALSREVTDLFLRILGRHTGTTDKMQEHVSTLVESSQDIDVDNFGRIHNLQSYYNVPEGEPTWTGDVLERRDRSEYAVIVTPTCDFAQRKGRPLDFIKLISAMRVNYNDLLEKDALKRVRDGLRISKKKTLKDCVKLILTGGLRKRFYVLTCLKDHQDNFFHLILDFQKISKLRHKEKPTTLGAGGWRRVCRIDTPIIDDLLQKYSSYSSRIGIQAIPSDIVEGTASKIETGTRSGS